MDFGRTYSYTILATAISCAKISLTIEKMPDMRDHWASSFYAHLTVFLETIGRLVDNSLISVYCCCTLKSQRKPVYNQHSQPDDLPCMTK